MFVIDVIRILIRIVCETVAGDGRASGKFLNISGNGTGNFTMLESGLIEGVNATSIRSSRAYLSATGGFRNGSSRPGQEKAEGTNELMADAIQGCR
jgi:hypothetical protein